jgi:hypothetical protein
MSLSETFTMSKVIAPDCVHVTDLAVHLVFDGVPRSTVISEGGPGSGAEPRIGQLEAFRLGTRLGSCGLVSDRAAPAVDLRIRCSGVRLRSTRTVR